MIQPIVQPLRRWDPERIGPYVIIGKLGAGAMGQVFLAKSAAGRLVAVKTIRMDLAEEPGFRDRFAREVAAARRVSGVFTAAIIEADPGADLPWVATAYVAAPSLSTLVKEAGPLPVPAVRWLAASCAEALQSIHTAGLLHRDVKPSNVLVAPDGPRVIDFGLARAAERIELTTAKGASGTPAYMAPEQARDASQASPASDIFSLGATMVFAATGRSPYQGDTVMDILVRLANEPPDLTDVPQELERLLAACLARTPRNRPTSSSILSQLGPFAHPGEAGHGYLPESAMALISEYQRTPLRPTGELAGLPISSGRPAARPAPGEPAGHATTGSGVSSAREGTTAGSHTALPGFQSLSRHGAAPRPADHDPDSLSGSSPSAASGPTLPNLGRPGQERSREGNREGPRWRALRGAGRGAPAAPVLPLWGRVAAAAALVGAGVGIGVLVSRPPPGNQIGPLGPPPCSPQNRSGAPAVCVSQPWGDGETGYVLHGVGFSADARVSVSVAESHAAPGQLTTDASGTFNYTLDQEHHFFAGPLPVGTYHCTASEPGQHGATATFRVYPAGHVPAQPPPPPPPGGGQGQGQPPPQ